MSMLLLLLVWVSVSGGCETGVAFVDSILSVSRSLMANADIAFLKAYDAPTLNLCLEECCSGKYGACSVASFKKNSSHENCLHFNCRPLHKCKFLSSNSTDSFTFSSNPTSSSPPSSSASQESSTPEYRHHVINGHPPEQAGTKDLLDEESQFALKNDNTTVKPRKGVDALTPDALLAKSGVKPRKGVSIEDVPHSKLLPNSLNRSNVKPRKGVGPYSIVPESPSIAPSASTDFQLASTNFNSTNDDVMVDLVKVFEDDTRTTTESQTFPMPSAGEQHAKVTESTPLLLSSEPSFGSSSEASKTLPIHSSSSVLKFSTNTIEEEMVPPMKTLPTMITSAVVPEAIKGVHQSLETQTLVADYTSDMALDELIEAQKATEENDRRYKSSMHLVLSLVFGLLVLFAVLGVVAKRIYDGWVRRDYYRMNYLIDGIYNGVH